MNNYIVLLVTTLHEGSERYLLQTALKIPFSEMEKHGIYDIFDPKHRQWILERLPMHAQGAGIVKLDTIFEVVVLPETREDEEGVCH